MKQKIKNLALIVAVILGMSMTLSSCVENDAPKQDLLVGDWIYSFNETGDINDNIVDCFHFNYDGSGYYDQYDYNRKMYLNRTSYIWYLDNYDVLHIKYSDGSEVTRYWEVGSYNGEIYLTLYKQSGSRMYNGYYKY